MFDKRSHRESGRRAFAWAMLFISLTGCTNHPETLGAASAGGGPVEIHISCAAVGLELKLCQTASEAWAKRTGNSVKIMSASNDSGDRLGQYSQVLGMRSSATDVFLIDMTWPGILSGHLIDLNPYFSAPDKKVFFQTVMNNNTVQSELKAIPWYMDVGLLFYRKDLLEKYGEHIPKTWEELTRIAKHVQDEERKTNKRMWGYVFQAKSYEGLTCNALEWLADFGGGTIVDITGKITINNPHARAALSLATSWIRNIAPEGVFNYTEEESRGLFQSGNAVFLRNWPYVLSLANSGESPVKGKVGFTSLPEGDGSHIHGGALGGWSLAISKYSEHPKEAADLIKYLTSPAEQKRRFLEGGFSPTIESLYSDADVIANQPRMAEFRDIYKHAIARPSYVTATKYNRVSHAFSEKIRQALAKEISVDRALLDLEKKLMVIRQTGRAVGEYNGDKW